MKRQLLVLSLSQRSYFIEILTVYGCFSSGEETLRGKQNVKLQTVKSMNPSVGKKAKSKFDARKK